jgi:hypothetical protein
VFSRITTPLFGSLSKSIVWSITRPEGSTGIALKNTHMPTSSENDLPWQNSTAVLEYNEESVAIGRERQSFPRRQRDFDAWDAHSQADELPLSFVIEFNAAEREWHEGPARLAQQGR